MRVVSLVPAATEIAFALGALDDLVAVTHDCDYPPAVRTLPRVTRATIPPGASSREIDTLVRESAARGESTFHLDAAALRAASPDVILGQTLCAVCAVTLDQVPRELATTPRVVPLEADSLEGMLEDVRRVGSALGRDTEASHTVAALRARIASVSRAVAGRAHPRVACIEWIDPPFNGGHWVPEQVRNAGGQDVLGTAGTRSRELSWEEVRAARPDVVVVMPCGWDVRRAAGEAASLPDLGARVVAVDGNAYFSRPGPRLVDGIELLASILHPGLVAAPDGASATLLRVHA
ncbi:MAG TPA: cobalamin-binding protein [Candidatus Limnocylindria bacterium]|nr:cobalamin-binding protein [Candidatus Limnocylindria bacterium]